METITKKDIQKAIANSSRLEGLSFVRAKKTRKPLNNLKTMAEPSRYNVSEDEAGIKGKVLKNKLDLINKKELEDRETILLSDSYNFFLKQLKNKKIKFNLDLLFKLGGKWKDNTLISGFIGNIRRIHFHRFFKIIAKNVHRSLHRRHEKRLQKNAKNNVERI